MPTPLPKDIAEILGSLGESERRKWEKMRRSNRSFFSHTKHLHALVTFNSIFVYLTLFTTSSIINVTNPWYKERVKEYIASLHSEIEKLGGGDNDETMDAEDDKEQSSGTKEMEDDGYKVPQYESGEDYEKQSDFKAKAADAKNSGNIEEALEYYNEAVQAAPPSALLYANRSIALEKLGHYKAAEIDCKLALEQNPDSAKALKTRGKLRYKHLDDWEGALRYV